METSLTTSISSQVDWWWSRLFRPRLQGLTDEELWWEPVPEAWTVRPRDADGALVYEWPPGSLGECETPFTTMAWRLCHLTFSAMAAWALALEGDVDAGDRTGELEFPRDAAGAVAVVELWFGRWRAAFGQLTDADLWQPIGSTALGVDVPVMKLGRDDPLLNHVLHQHREVIHHGAEVCLLRDLYRSKAC